MRGRRILVVRLGALGDIIQTLTASGQFTTLLKALDSVNLTSVLKSVAVNSTKSP